MRSPVRSPCLTTVLVSLDAPATTGVLYALPSRTTKTYGFPSGPCRIASAETTIAWRASLVTMSTLTVIPSRRNGSVRSSVHRRDDLARRVGRVVALLRDRRDLDDVTRQHLVAEVFAADPGALSERDRRDVLFVDLGADDERAVGRDRGDRLARLDRIAGLQRTQRVVRLGRDRLHDAGKRRTDDEPADLVAREAEIRGRAGGVALPPRRRCRCATPRRWPEPQRARPAPGGPTLAPRGRDRRARTARATVDRRGSRAGAVPDRR